MLFSSDEELNSSASSINSENVSFASFHRSSTELEPLSHRSDIDNMDYLASSTEDEDFGAPFLPFVVELQSYNHYNLKKQHHRVAITLLVVDKKSSSTHQGDLDKPSLTGSKIFSSMRDLTEWEEMYIKWWLQEARYRLWDKRYGDEWREWEKGLAIEDADDWVDGEYELEYDELIHEDAETQMDPAYDYMYDEAVDVEEDGGL